MSKPAQPSSTAAAPRKKTRLARFFMDDKIQKDSALLPSDKWIIKTALDILKTNKELRKYLTLTGVFTTLMVGAAAAGIAGELIAATTTIALPLAISAATAALPFIIGGVAIAAVLVCGKKALNSWKKIKTETLPKLRGDLSSRYFKMQGAQIMDEMKKRLEENRKKKAEKKAAAPEAPKPAQEAPKPAEPAKKPSLADLFGGLKGKKRPSEKLAEPKNPPPPDLKP